MEQIRKMEQVKEMEQVPECRNVALFTIYVALYLNVLLLIGCLSLFADVSFNMGHNVSNVSMPLRNRYWRIALETFLRCPHYTATATPLRSLHLTNHLQSSDVLVVHTSPNQTSDTNQPNRLPRSWDQHHSHQTGRPHPCQQHRPCPRQRPGTSSR